MTEPEHIGNEAVRSIKSRRPRCRTGCMTCRIRRIKCDESKPVCFRCQSTGRKCDGYPPNTAHGYSRKLLKCKSGCSDLAKKEVFGMDGLSGPSYHSSLTAIHRPVQASPSLKISRSEQRSLHYFYHRTVPSLSGYFNSPSSSSFWTSTLLQAINSEPSVQQAALALSVLHEALELNGDLRPENTDNFRRTRSALYLYNKAISQTLRVMSLNSSQSSKSNVALISCLLFICHELLQDHYNMGTNHLLQGFYLAGSVPASDLDKDISSMFTQLLIQTLFFGIDRFQLEFIPAGDEGPSEITSFSSLLDAKLALDHLFLKLHILKLDLRRRAPKHTILESHNSICVLTSSWERAFESLVSEGQSSFTIIDVTAFKFLQLHHVCLVIMLEEIRLNQTASQSAAGLSISLTSCYDSLLILASSLLQPPTTASSNQPPPHLRRFTFTLGLIAPLFFTAIKCRSITLRRKAIALLTHPSIPYREGVWGSVSAAAIATMIFNIELGIKNPSPTTTIDSPYIDEAGAEAQHEMDAKAGNEARHEIAFEGLPVDLFDLDTPPALAFCHSLREEPRTADGDTGEGQWDVETPTLDDGVMKLRVGNRREVVVF